MQIDPSSNIHSTAIVDEGALIGSNTKIWHWVHICKGAKIGNNCNLGQNVFIGNNVEIGNYVKIQNNVSIFDNVYLDDYVFCGPSVVFTNVLNPRSSVSRKNSYLNTNIGKGATLGANSTILCGNNIGSHSFIGAGAVITRDVKPFALMVGNPARHVGWMSTYGEKIPLPLNGYGNWKCQKKGIEYFLKDGQISINSIN